MINMCIVGLGGCGVKMTDSFLSLTKAYDGYFINSNSNEVKKLKNSNPTNIIHISGANGTGRNPEIGRKQIIENQEKIGLFFEDKAEYQMYTLISSTSGGFGSGSIWGVIDILRDISPNAKINIIGVLPKYNAIKYELENTLLYYVKLNEYIKVGKIDGYTFILNEKMTGDENEFNTKAMSSFLDSIELSGGEIDDSDIIESLSNGYNLILDLNDKVIQSHSSVHSFIENSIFAVPDGNLTSNYMLAQVTKGEYNKFTLEREFDTKRLSKVEYNDYGINSVLLGGCHKPSSYFKKFESTLNSIKSKEKEDIISDDYIPSISIKPRTEIKVDQSSQSESRHISRKERRERLKNILK